jgi:hypothetical protein
MTPKTKTKSLPRRAFLRGVLAGVPVSIGLPSLECLWNGNGTALANGAAPPKRFLLYFWGNGVRTERWVPKATGAGFALSDQLQAFADPTLRPYVSLITNLTCNGSAHITTTTRALTGGELTPEPGSQSPALPSIDQLVADELGKETPLRSLELGTHAALPGAGGQVLNAISGRGGKRANYPILDPRVAFERVFGASPGGPGGGTEPQLALRRSVIDAVLEDATSLRASLGAGDRVRLDQSLDQLRGLERRIGRLAATAAACKVQNDSGTLGAQKLDTAFVTANMTEIHRLQSTLLAQAFACGVTRVASFMFTNPAAHVRYTELRLSGSFHELTHNEPGEQPQAHAGILYAMDRLADTLKALRATPDGPGNLLDSLAIYATSCIAVGHGHRKKDHPALVIGKAGGALRGGIHHRMPAEASITHAALTAARAAGAALPAFGAGADQATKSVDALLA